MLVRIKLHLHNQICRGIKAASRVYWVWHEGPDTWKLDVIVRLKYDFIQPQRQRVPCEEKRRRSWPSEQYLIAAPELTLSWSLSPVKVPLLRQQPGRVPKKQHGDAKPEEKETPVRTHNCSPLLCLFWLTPLLPPCPLFPSPPVPCRAHGAKRCDSISGCCAYLSVSFLNYPRDKSIILGRLMVSSSQGIAALAHITH